MRAARLFSLSLALGVVAGCRDRGSGERSAPDARLTASASPEGSVDAGSPDAPGDLTSRAAIEVGVYAPVSGSVRRVVVKVGDAIQEGQVVAVVRWTELAGARAALNKAQAESALAKRTFARISQLHDLGEITIREWGEATAEYESALRAVRSARAQVDRLQAVGEAGAGQPDDIAVRAPVAGRVSARFVEPDDAVSAGDERGTELLRIVSGP